MALRLPHRADADRETDIPHLRLDEVSQVGQEIKCISGVVTAGANWRIVSFRFADLVCSVSSLWDPPYIVG